MSRLILDKYKDHPSSKLIKAKNNSQVFKLNLAQCKLSF